jgi:putative transcriptional regulator
LAGRLLVATPGLVDPNFSRSVILLLAHSDDGALGVALNRPGGLEARDVVPQWAHLVAPPEVVFVGGPVQPDTALCVAATPDGWTTIDVKRDPESVRVSRIRLFAAYSGWSRLQLESEIDAGGWYVVDARQEDLFTDSPEQLWRRVLRRQGGRTALASTAPDDPLLN